MISDQVSVRVTVVYMYVSLYSNERDNSYLNSLFSFSIFNNAKSNSCLIFHKLVSHIGFLHLCFFFKSMASKIVCSKVKDFPILWKENIEINTNFRISEHTKSVRGFFLLNCTYQTDQGTAATLIVFFQVFSTKPEVKMLHY